MRFCVDYRQLNKITMRDSHPLPRIVETLYVLGGAHYFSTLALRCGFSQIEVDDDSKEKTAFITHNGLWQFEVLPFGLCNSPSTFHFFRDAMLAGHHVCAKDIFMNILLK